ncbi:uncharacterized protein CEXT_358461 [Caerostris extrusa]|uniref:Uncharacterized protein n=1 Tax=Caerostris extrusa TaxID=172846 RepID=A0AAV4TT61_CAEEX|nr:uncharacterized protein CEXT_358461 [Caerostris extrusa]
MRRRNTGSNGRRKTRNNLTIPTPEEPGRENNRNTWVRDGGVIRIDRPVDNGSVLNTRDVIALDNEAIEREDERRNDFLQRLVLNTNNNNNGHLNYRRSVSLDQIATL